MAHANMPARARAAFSALVLAMSTACSGPAWASPADYVLGPQDKLRIKVYDWRNNTGEAHEWTALTGEFSVGASGKIDLPLAGEIVAAGRTTSAVARDLGERLQQKVGLAQQPDASIEVVEYRPFYIVGAVEKAGAYPYRPDLTVLQAVGIAGGVARTQNTSELGYERQAMSDRGQLRMLVAERVALLGRQARLDAEISNANEIVFSGEIASHQTNPQMVRLVREEQLLFTNGRNNLAMQIDNLNKTRDILQNEITALAAKDVSVAHQLELTRKEFDTISSLVTKGLTVLPRQLAVEQDISQYESSRLDLQLAQLRAKQDISRIDRDILDLKDKRRASALAESRETQAKLMTLDEQIKTAQSLAEDTENHAPEMAAEADQDRPSAPILHGDAGGRRHCEDRRGQGNGCGPAGRHIARVGTSGSASAQPAALTAGSTRDLSTGVGCEARHRPASIVAAGADANGQRVPMPWTISTRSRTDHCIRCLARANSANRGVHDSKIRSASIACQIGGGRRAVFASVLPVEHANSAIQNR